MNRLHFVALSVLMLIPLACQKGKPVDTSGVDPVAQDILKAIAQGNAQSAYDTYFTPEYKSEMSPTEWKEIAQGYKELFGGITAVKRLRGSARWIGGQFIDGQVSYDVTWEKGTGNMTLDVTKEDGWKVRQLRIESPQIDARMDKINSELSTETSK